MGSITTHVRIEHDEYARVREIFALPADTPPEILENIYDTQTLPGQLAATERRIKNYAHKQLRPAHLKGLDPNELPPLPTICVPTPQNEDFASMLAEIKAVSPEHLEKARGDYAAGTPSQHHIIMDDGSDMIAITHNYQVPGGARADLMDIARLNNNHDVHLPQSLQSRATMSMWTLRHEEAHARTTIDGERQRDFDENVSKRAQQIGTTLQELECSEEDLIPRTKSILNNYHGTLEEMRADTYATLCTAQSMVQEGQSLDGVWHLLRTFHAARAIGDVNNTGSPLHATQEIYPEIWHKMEDIMQDADAKDAFLNQSDDELYHYALAIVRQYANQPEKIAGFTVQQTFWQSLKEQGISTNLNAAEFPNLDEHCSQQPPAIQEYYKHAKDQAEACMDYLQQPKTQEQQQEDEQSMGGSSQVPTHRDRIDEETTFQFHHAHIQLYLDNEILRLSHYAEMIQTAGKPLMSNEFIRDSMAESVNHIHRKQREHELDETTIPENLQAYLIAIPEPPEKAKDPLQPEL